MITAPGTIGREVKHHNLGWRACLASQFHAMSLFKRSSFETKADFRLNPAAHLTYLDAGIALDITRQRLDTVGITRGRHMLFAVLGYLKMDVGPQFNLNQSRVAGLGLKSPSLIQDFGFYRDHRKQFSLTDRAPQEGFCCFGVAADGRGLSRLQTPLKTYTVVLAGGIQRRSLNQPPMATVSDGEPFQRKDLFFVCHGSPPGRSINMAFARH
jgi:hypothetical protein